MMKKWAWPPVSGHRNPAALFRPPSSILCRAVDFCFQLSAFSISALNLLPACKTIATLNGGLTGEAGAS
jgi:hypothetical protein